jgi:hypothetical protein
VDECLSLLLLPLMVLLLLLLPLAKVCGHHYSF